MSDHKEYQGEQAERTEEQKSKALSLFLGIYTQEIVRASYGKNVFEIIGDKTGKEYLVLTDKEATEIAKAQVLKSASTFSKEFLDKHSDVISKLTRKEFFMLQSSTNREKTNPIVLAMLRDTDAFVTAALSENGRGYFLSGFDSEENEVNGFFIYRIN